MIIFINSSKTMGQVAKQPGSQTPTLLPQARKLNGALQQLSPDQLAKLMHISPELAAKTAKLINDWATQPQTTAALDAFQGDIFKGLRAATFSDADRTYANKHLRILSGLYAILKPFDAIKPYRLELAYALKVGKAVNLYDFWGDLPAQQLPTNEIIVQLASQEYYRLFEPYIDAKRVITPRFMTQIIGKKATFVTVHAKVTRGAFARWIILNRIEKASDLEQFCELGYRYDASNSTAQSPLFVTDRAIKPTAF